MKTNIIGKNIDMTPALEEAVNSSIKKLNKYFNETTEMQVTLSVEKQRHIVEITIPFSGQVLRAEVEGSNMYKIIDEAVDIIEKQIVRFKNKLRTKQRNADLAHFTPSFMEEDDHLEEVIQINRRKKFAIKPMDAEEAVMQMELIGHNFYVFLDAQTEEVNVVYKRKNNTYGLIEPELY
ncbi:MAG: ribosomal subunit interface protein [Epulopiscium sp. Nele67-Bin005]|nr:MAG: ribosomal subunit interface protein [Epulopiscium sp. Nele67-Bin005]